MQRLDARIPLGVDIGVVLGLECHVVRIEGEQGSLGRERCFAVVHQRVVVSVPRKPEVEEDLPRQPIPVRAGRGELGLDVGEPGVVGAVGDLGDLHGAEGEVRHRGLK